MRTRNVYRIYKRLPLTTEWRLASQTSYESIKNDWVSDLKARGYQVIVDII